jgi:hypothetical protein
VRDALVLAQHVLAQLGRVARLVRTARAPVPHLVVTLSNNSVRQNILLCNYFGDVIICRFILVTGTSTM